MKYIAYKPVNKSFTECKVLPAFKWAKFHHSCVHVHAYMSVCAISAYTFIEEYSSRVCVCACTIIFLYMCLSGCVKVPSLKTCWLNTSPSRWIVRIRNVFPATLTCVVYHTHTYTHTNTHTQKTQTRTHLHTLESVFTWEKYVFGISYANHLERCTHTRTHKHACTPTRTCTDRPTHTDASTHAHPLSNVLKHTLTRPSGHCSELKLDPYCLRVHMCIFVCMLLVDATTLENRHLYTLRHQSLWNTQLSHMPRTLVSLTHHTYLSHAQTGTLMMHTNTHTYHAQMTHSYRTHSHHTHLTLTTHTYHAHHTHLSHTCDTNTHTHTYTHTHTHTHTHK